MTTLQTPHTRALSIGDHVRLVWAVASKDIVDALKNRTTLTTIVTVLLMVLFYRFYGALLNVSEPTRVLVAAAADSPLLAALQSSPELDIYLYDSADRALNLLRDVEDVELGLIITPQDDAQLADPGPIVVQGYAMNWLSARQRADVQTLTEEELSLTLGRPVTVNLTGNDVYLRADDLRFGFSAPFALVFVLVMVAITLVPHLMLEEKRTGTLDALLVSPLTATHLIAGKALAGLFYALTGGVIALIAFQHLVLQWGIAVAALLLGTLFMVALGLLLGTFITNKAQLQVVTWFIVLPLLLPVFLVLLQGVLPDVVVAIINWIPTVTVARLYRLSFTPDAALRHLGWDTLSALLLSQAVLALAVWRTRQSEQ